MSLPPQTRGPSATVRRRERSTTPNSRRNKAELDAPSANPAARPPCTAPRLPVRAAVQNPCSHALFGFANPPPSSVCDQSVPNRELLPPNKPNKKRRICGAFPIGAPGFEPGTSPTRIMGEIRRRCKKHLQIDGFRCKLASSQMLGFCRRFPGFRQRDRLAAQRRHRRQRPARRLPRSWRRASAPATAQAPNRRLTTLAAGHSLSASRPSASPPRWRACVRDQSYEDGSLP